MRELRLRKQETHISLKLHSPKTRTNWTITTYHDHIEPEKANNFGFSFLFTLTCPYIFFFKAALYTNSSALFKVELDAK